MPSSPLRPLVLFIGCCALSVVLYLALFATVVGKPLTVGFMDVSFQVKSAHARTIEGPKLVIVAGSNGMISHRCETLEAETGWPCVNAAVTAALGVELILAKARQFLKSGDVVVMPWEYTLYVGDIIRDGGYPYLVAHDRGLLFDQPSHRIAEALFSFDFHFLVSALVETGLATAGVERRFNRDTLNRHGDLVGHTPELAADFVDAVVDFPVPVAAELTVASESLSEIETFLDWCADNGIRVIGTLPTVPDSTAISESLVQAIARLYESRGHLFVATANRGRYPRACFYDTFYHLNESCQIRHSRLVAERIRPFLAPTDESLPSLHPAQERMSLGHEES